MRESAANLIQTHLKNKQAQLDIKNAPLKEQLLRAQIQHALRAPQLTGDAGTLEYLRTHPDLLSNQSEEKEKENGRSFLPSITGGAQNPEEELQDNSGKSGSYADQIKQNILKKLSGIKDPRSYAPSKILKLQQELSQVESGTNPATGLPFKSKEEQDRAAAPYKEELTGLKKGTHYIYDNSGREIGQVQPLSNDEKKVETGRAFFNPVFDLIRKGTDYYSGKDSITRFDRDARNYEKDPKARERIKNLIVANNLISAGTVNEAATLGAGKQLAVFDNLKSSLSSLDIPKKIQSLELGFNIPHEAFEETGRTTKQILNEATESASRSVPATRIRYYHPEKHMKKMDNNTSGNQSNGTTLLIGEKGQKYHVPNDKVKAYLLKHRNLRHG
jgi:hypothetical protein